MPNILEDGDEFFNPRSSTGSSCLLPQWMFVDNQPQQRGSPSYERMSQEPLALTIQKLDGSSFDIEVPKMGTVGDLKHAVEEAFCHLPKNGPGGVSWSHVWGQFCICFDGVKLLNDSDCIGMFGINDGDELQFIRHYSSNLAETESEAEDFDSDYEATVTHGEEPQNDEPVCYHRIDIEDNWDDTELDKYSAISERQSSSLSQFFRCWFRPYSKMSRSQTRPEKRSSSLKVPYNNSGSFKDVNQFYSNSTNSRNETWKGKYDGF